MFVEGGFRSGEAKMAFLEGRFRWGVGVPHAVKEATIREAERSRSGGSSEPLTIAKATFAETQFSTEPVEGAQQAESDHSEHQIACLLATSRCPHLRPQSGEAPGLPTARSNRSSSE